MSTAKTILLLAANPQPSTRGRLELEMSKIDKGLRLSQNREHFHIEQRWASRIRDIHRALQDCQPDIVHFIGNERTTGIVLEDDIGNEFRVTPETLIKLFERWRNQINCLLLIACYVDAQARAINRHIQYVVGVDNAVGDPAVIEFTVGFYYALGMDNNVEKAFEFGYHAMKARGIPQAAVHFLEQKPGITTANANSTNELASATELQRIFISYKCNIEPDDPVASEIASTLRNRGYNVYIDNENPKSADWGKRINDELHKADFFIPIFSHLSFDSEIIKSETIAAYQLMKKQGKPRILPVRLNFRESFLYPLSEYLNRINWAVWSKNGDTLCLIDELVHAIFGKELPITPEQHNNYLEKKSSPKIPIPAYTAQLPQYSNGNMDPESRFYIQRPSDIEAMNTIRDQGVTLTVYGQHQTGKTSLLMRIAKAAQFIKKRVAYLDFKSFDGQSFENSDTFYYQFCTVLTKIFKLEDTVDEYWDMDLDDNMRCTLFVEQHVLKSINNPILFAMDEIDILFNTPVGPDFFSTLRHWHNQRKEHSVWKNLDIALATSDDPLQQIENLSQTPFNVGVLIELNDFTQEQVNDLNRRHRFPFNEQQEQQLSNLLSGHPYLVRKAMYLVTTNQITVSQLFQLAADDDGPFSDHLQNHLFRIHNDVKLIRGMQQVIDTHSCDDEQIRLELHAIGLVKRDADRVVPRCELYDHYFKERIVGGI